MSANMMKFPCSKCMKNVTNNQKAILCDVCSNWKHCKCDFISNEFYNNITDQTKWCCQTCINHALPFDHDSKNSNNTTGKIVNNNIYDIDNNTGEFLKEIESIDESDTEICNHYTLEEKIGKISKPNIFSIMHLNIASLKLHIPSRHQDV